MNSIGLSVITVHRNEFEGLELTRRSLEKLKKQDTNTPLQWIVIDGASDIPVEYDPFQSVQTSADVFVSEPDKGIYDAMNKGVKYAKEQLVVFMNAGDTFEDSFNLSKALKSIDTSNTPCMIWFSSFEGKTGEEKHKKMTRSPSSLWWGMPTHHQAMFFRRDLLRESPYDLELSIAADYDLVCRLWVLHKSVQTIEAPLCEFDLSGLSSRRFWLGLRQQQIIRSRVLKIDIFRNMFIWIAKAFARIFRNFTPMFYGKLRYQS